MNLAQFFSLSFEPFKSNSCLVVVRLPNPADPLVDHELGCNLIEAKSNPQGSLEGQ